MSAQAPIPPALDILIVDDEPDFLEPITFWLTAKGYRVTQAESGEQALDIIRRQRIDVVFLDVTMPVMDGIETLRRIRTSNKTLPVVLITADYMEENRFAGARGLGISGLFPKAGSLEEFAEALSIALKIHQGLKPPRDPH